MNGKYVPSLLAAIGGVIERHMIDTGFLKADSPGFAPAGDHVSIGEAAALGMRYCPKCDAPSLVFQEGCHTCLSCGYSKCG